ncbi:MAG: hypothetical protein M1825_006437 [Sarcosagium campestre]|nr:MAG: hypothetical protein M1825_006437 [Sarcosagium campestre]
MAPATISTIEGQLQALLQITYTLSVQIHAYQGGGTTQTALQHTIQAFVASLRQLAQTAPHLTPAVSIPPEIVAYVEDGRNPDIYTREFVEIVQRSGRDVGGRAEAFAGFRDVLAGEMVGVLPEVRGEVEKVVRSTGGGGGGAANRGLSREAGGAAGEDLDKGGAGNGDTMASRASA